MLDVSQQELALAAGVSRSHIAGVESGRVNPSIDLVWRIAERLGIEIDIIHRSPILLGRRTSRDLVHARCSGYVEGRLLGAGWVMRREVEVMANRAHGWIDLLAFEPISRTLVIVEIKTRLDDLAAVERQLGWYERHAMDIAHSLGWHPRRFLTWLILLASDEVEGALVDHRQLLRRTFPERAAVMRAVVIDGRAKLGRGGSRESTRLADAATGCSGLAPMDDDRRRHIATMETQHDASLHSKHSAGIVRTTGRTNVALRHAI